MIPRFRAVYARASTPYGLVMQHREAKPDYLDTLLAVTGYDQNGLFFEKNTGSMMLRPAPRAANFSVAELAPNVRSGDAGNWVQCPGRSSGIREISQKSAIADVAWSAETNAQILNMDLHPFSMRIRRGPCPKAGSHTPADYYTHIVWPSDAIAGDNMYRIRFAYEQSPVLEQSTDAGVTWIHGGVIPVHGEDGLKIMRGENFDVTLTILLIKTSIIVWLGSDLNRETLTFNGQGVSVDYKPGKIRVEGKNGTAQFGFSHLRFNKAGFYVSPPRVGPRYLDSAVRFHFDGLTSSLVEQTVTGAIVDRNYGKREYTYRMDLTSAPITEDDTKEDFEYSVTTPVITSVTPIWPCVFKASPAARFVNLPLLKRVEHRAAFDIPNQIVSYSASLIVNNDFGDYIQNHPNQLVRLYGGWEHTGWFPHPIATLTANIDTEWTALRATSEVSMRCSDLLDRMAEMPLRDKILPGGWCVYALVHLLTETMGITPEVTKFIPDCESGPTPQCEHQKFPKRGLIWEPLTPGLTCLREVQKVAGAVMGTDRYGYFRFYRFRPDAPYRVTSGYNSAGGSAINGYLDAIIGKYKGVERFSSSREIRNDWTIVGPDEQTGNLFAVHDQNWASIYNRLAPNYKGYISPFIRAWTGYSNRAFAEEELQRIAYWSNLPAEKVRFPTFGQPTEPLSVFRVIDPRTVGYRSHYYLTENVGIFDPMQFNNEGALLYESFISGAWTGRGAIPGRS